LLSFVFWWFLDPVRILISRVFPRPPEERLSPLLRYQLGDLDGVHELTLCILTDSLALGVGHMGGGRDDDPEIDEELHAYGLAPYCGDPFGRYSVGGDLCPVLLNLS
jgi:hypothetical protein